MILQLGTGAFLRGFFDWMLHEVGYDGRVVVSGLTHGGAAEALRARDLRFTHAIRGRLAGETIDESFVNGVLTEALDPYADWEQLRAVAMDPALELIVTNGTEAGMLFEPTSSPNPCPEPFIAKLAALLVARFHALGDTPEAKLLVIATELVEENGAVLESVVLRHALEWGTDGSFDPWLDKHVQFASSLVDRIVAKAPTEEDPLAISSEPYHLWVLEDRCALGRILNLGQLNVRSVLDLEPWRERKVRLLNGGHACLVFTGLLAGVEHVADAMEHATLRPFLERCLREEVLPGLEGDRGDLEAYLEDVLERFANPFIDHRLDAILLNSQAKIHLRLLPSMHDHVERTGELPKGLTLALAAFLLVYRDLESGDEARVLARHRAGWEAGGVAKVLADPVLFPPRSLAGLPGLTAAVEAALARLEADPQGALI